MQRELVEQVRRRAGFRCEYCHFPERFSGLNFQIDHVIAEKHGGPTDGENFALSCIYRPFAPPARATADARSVGPATGRRRVPNPQGGRGTSPTARPSPIPAASRFVPSSRRECIGRVSSAGTPDHSPAIHRWDQRPPNPSKPRRGER